MGRASEGRIKLSRDDHDYYEHARTAGAARGRRHAEAPPPTGNHLRDGADRAASDTRAHVAPLRPYHRRRVGEDMGARRDTHASTAGRLREHRRPPRRADAEL